VIRDARVDSYGVLTLVRLEISNQIFRQIEKLGLLHQPRNVSDGTDRQGVQIKFKSHASPNKTTGAIESDFSHKYLLPFLMIFHFAKEFNQYTLVAIFPGMYIFC
jgi:hypothetical protein